MDSSSSSEFNFIDFAQREADSSQSVQQQEADSSKLAPQRPSTPELLAMDMEDPRFQEGWLIKMKERCPDHTPEEREAYLWERAETLPLDECEMELWSHENPMVPLPRPQTPRNLLNKRARYWMATHNDWTPYTLMRIRGRLRPFNITYCCIFKETAPTTGHIHAHSIFCFSNTVRFDTLAKIDPGAHWSSQGNGPVEIYKYISKDGHKVFEYGTPPASIANYLDKQANQRQPQPKKPTQFDMCLQLLKDGKIEELKEQRVYAQYQRYFDQRIMQTIPCDRWKGDLKNKNHWVYGPPGSGKSSAIWDAAEAAGLSVYVKLQNKWWDGYRGQDIVLIEDAAPDWMSKAAANMKVWSDRYAFNAEVKGSSITIPTPSYYLVVTSNYSMEECFNATDLQAMRRRFEEHFKDLPSVEEEN